MKSSFIILVSFFLILGCSELKDLTDGENFEIVSAGYDHWREAPVQGGDVPEVGTNLAVIVRDWPEEGYTPKFIVFNGRKSSPVEISLRRGDEVVMNATIIRSSSLINNTSEEVNVSDRLAYIGPDGEAGFLEIEEWVEL